MNIAISHALLLSLLKKQLDNSFILTDNEEKCIERCLSETLIKTELCFSNTPNKYYTKNNETYFSPYHSGQYSIFLYFLSRTVFEENSENNILADKIYYLNKIMNSVDIYYEVKMPEIFMLDHPLGSVMGRAKYENFFTFSQQCTIGNNKGVFPVIGEHVTMYSGSKIIGKCSIGNHVTIAANTYIKDTNIPDNSIVFGSSPNLTIKTKK
jgi:serine O-acetyltransferase